MASAKRLAYRRKYAANNKEKLRAQYKKWYEANWQKYYSKNKARIAGNLKRSRDAGKHIARQAVNSKLRNGLMKRGQCEVCSSKRTQAHHDDYSKPTVVRWLCAKHHKALHIGEL